MGPDYRTAAETPRDLLDGNEMSLIHHDWGFTSGLLPGRPTRYFQGKVAGGSSAVGNTIAIRGVPEDFEESFLNGTLAAGYSYTDDHNHPDSTATGYLTAEVRARPNLTINPDAVVQRVLLNGEVVRGVEVLAGSAPQELRARRVILAAGAVGSPAILLRSGIGPQDDTGQMRPHPYPVPAQFVMRTASMSTGRTNDMYYAMVNHFDLSVQFPHLREAAQADRVYAVLVVGREPNSRGSVRLASTDPRVAPSIDLNFLPDERDHQFLADGLRVGWELSQSPKIRDLADRVAVLNDSMLNSPEAVRAYVDQRGGVHGIPGLHVADASVLPSMVRANIDLTVIMMAECLAEMLRDV